MDALLRCFPELKAPDYEPDPDCLAHPPPRPFPSGVETGDEGDAVQRQVERVKERPGSVEMIIPSEKYDGESKLFWNIIPKPNADEPSNEETAGQLHNLVTYLHHTDRITPAHWSDDSGQRSPASYGTLHARYDLFRMFDLSGRRTSGEQTRTGRLMLDPNVDLPVLGREIDYMETPVRQLILEQGEKLQAEHGDDGWWRPRGGCHSAYNIDTDPAFEIPPNQPPPGCTLTESWLFDPSIDGTSVYKPTGRRPRRHVAVRAIQRWTAEDDDPPYSQVTLIKSYLPGTDLAGPPTKVCIQFDGCVVNSPESDEDQDAAILMDLRPAMFPCDYNNPKKRDRVSPSSAGDSSGVVFADTKAVRSAAVNDNEVDLPPGLHQALDVLAHEYERHYGSRRLLSPWCAQWQLCSDGEPSWTEATKPRGIAWTRSVGLQASKYPSVSWEYRYRPETQDEVLATQARIHAFRKGITRRYEYKGSGGKFQMTSMHPKGQDMSDPPNVVRLMHRGQVTQPRSRDSGIPFAAKPFFASLEASEVLHADSLFPVCGDQECVILPDRIAPQISLVDALEAEGLSRPAARLKQWRAELSEKHGQGDWQFVVGAFDAIQSCSVVSSDAAPTFGNVALTGWWEFVTTAKSAEQGTSKAPGK